VYVFGGFELELGMHGVEVGLLSHIGEQLVVHGVGVALCFHIGVQLVVH
jgi:hypothetical protein